RKGKVIWSQDEDEAVISLWTKGFDDEEIARTVKFKGKSREDVKKRRAELLRKDDERFAKMLGREKGVSALERAMGKQRYAWMKPGGSGA
ncbi:hypothetical protein EK21DRAFT_73560, partial [Setomelanomma holmii]